jgi:hypothetical protein
MEPAQPQNNKEEQRQNRRREEELRQTRAKQKRVLKTVGICVAVIAPIVLIFGGLNYYHNQPGELDGFAQCLEEKGAIFYGAFWCPHCQNQKAMFGRSARLLPYVECSTADGKGQLPVCTQRGVESYPTWVFADGTRESGEVSLPRLAEKTSCALP